MASNKGNFGSFGDVSDVNRVTLLNEMCRGMAGGEADHKGTVLNRKVVDLALRGDGIRLVLEKDKPEATGFCGVEIHHDLGAENAAESLEELLEIRVFPRWR